ncbi:T9SS type A sorting domain-containing protein [Flavobacterium dankookense]|uniref:Putative secreted protein (Por secretion system target) n=1 Tax=Flavobacterium dankookense TaxID=706186 RepID=A0A4R6QC43_9FLAO|nr:T9SS type A sorting domain-containing protein [Flavobacterium dankookense]TDP60324.1 putative secreted protein (Por secretion system target) [Flavobacterium dankookense]
MKKIILGFLILACNLIQSQSIISVTPDNGNKGQNLQVTITSQDVDFVTSTPIINVSFIDQFSNILSAEWAEIISENELLVNLSIPGYATPGLYDVNVFDDSGNLNYTLSDGFTVNNSYTYSLQGNIRYDSNNNGCDASDVIVPNQQITFTNGSTTGNLIANQTGFYNYYDVQAGNYTFTPVIENPSYFTITPNNANVVLSANNNLIVQDFCISPNGIHNDLEISIIALNDARPGFNSDYKIIYKNKGNSVQSGSINLNFNDSLMDLISSTPIANAQVTNSITWNFTNLLPFQSGIITFKMNVNTPSENPPVNNGDNLVFTANCDGNNNDETPLNNTSTLNQIVVGSYDPNDKTCTQGEELLLSEVGKFLTYVIRFENTGTANAEFVVIRDNIDTSKFDINTLTVLSASHSFTTKILNNNQVEFIFENINLPFDDANNDGYVAFKIKTKSNLTLGTNISNTAAIYFDYNLPIITNTYTTRIVNQLNTADFDLNNLFSLSPVPVKSELNIETKELLEIKEINIYNMLGQLLFSEKNPSKSIDVSILKSGSYIITISSNKGTLNTKFIKE